MDCFGLDFSIYTDPLSMFFVFVIGLIAIPAAVFSISYLKGYSLRKRVWAWILLVLFVLTMAMVVIAANTLLFLIAWEAMSLVSYFLVVFNSEDPKSVKAGIIYLVMTHIGTAFITVAFLIMYRYSGSFDTAQIKNACAMMPGSVKNALFLCFLVGFGTKAGVVPFHVWLPYAHPQAPSHISSLMSGVMIKTAVYGLIRFVIMTLGVQALWWGNLLLSLAAVSCLVGVMYALIEHDIKRLLAYHSVENIGIILLGVGASMVFIKQNMPLAAAFALAAGLYHLVNHAIFKSLLFMGAGSVYEATGVRNIEQLGGLSKKMPWTYVSFLIGAMAISALPPLNGFVSEWLTLQALFLGVLSGPGRISVVMGLLGAVLALTGGLAAACFVKAYGVTFLAMPRSEEAKSAKESPFSMVSPMLFLAVLTALFGLFASGILKTLMGISGSALGVNTVNFNAMSWHSIKLVQNGGHTALSVPALSLVMLAAAGAVFCVLYLLYGARKKRIYGTWDCGYYKLDERNEYTATAFSKPFRIAFDFFYRPYRKTEEVKESKYFVKSTKYHTFITPVFKKYIYQKAVKRALNAANIISKLQSGSIHFYIAYIFATVLILLLFLH
jgi:hydrogenase-4 component B